MPQVQTDDKKRRYYLNRYETVKSNAALSFLIYNITP
jgi:hypothetical protein